jgi:hypothetical protein
MSWEHVMVFWNILDGGSSRSGSLLCPFESLWDDTPGTNPRQHVNKLKNYREFAYMNDVGYDTFLDQVTACSLSIGE